MARINDVVQDGADSKAYSDWSVVRNFNAGASQEHEGAGRKPASGGHEPTHSTREARRGGGHNSGRNDPPRRRSRSRSRGRRHAEEFDRSRDDGGGATGGSER